MAIPIALFMAVGQVNAARRSAGRAPSIPHSAPPYPPLDDELRAISWKIDRREREQAKRLAANAAGDRAMGRVLAGTVVAILVIALVAAYFIHIDLPR